MKKAESRGFIDLYFLDESGFSLTPYVPYAWQAKGQTIELPTQGGKRFNVLGFMTAKSEQDNDLVAYTTDGNFNSDAFIACMNDFVHTRSEPTVIVLDNAPVHRSEKVLNMIPQWQKMGVGLFFLPRYSPHLNPIEILWRKMKYEWMPLTAYVSWNSLTDAVNDMICRFGQSLTINFA